MKQGCAKNLKMAPSKRMHDSTTDESTGSPKIKQSKTNDADSSDPVEMTVETEEPENTNVKVNLHTD